MYLLATPPSIFSIDYSVHVVVIVVEVCVHSCISCNNTPATRPITAVGPSIYGQRNMRVIYANVKGGKVS